MTNNTMEVLIISPSIALREGLSALLESLPGITAVKAIKELSNSHTWIENHQPRIVMLDTTSASNDLIAALERINRLSPITQRILLVEEVSQVRWVPQYAEAILIKGAPASAVVTIVSNLMLAKGEENEHNASIQ